MGIGRTDEAAKASREAKNRTLLYAALIVLAGVLLLWLITGLSWFDRHTTIQALLEQLGGLIITTGGLAVLWDLRGRRDMIEEVLARVELRSDLETTGLKRASMDWRVVPWKELIGGARNVEVLISYGNSWLSTYSPELTKFAADRRNKLLYVLPDPDDEVTMRELAVRYDSSPEIIEHKVREAAQTVARLSRDGKAEVRVRYRVGAPTFTCYRFDETVVVTLYSHQLGRPAIPAFVLGSGTMHDFFAADLAAARSQGREVGVNKLLGDVHES